MGLRVTSRASTERLKAVARPANVYAFTVGIKALLVLIFVTNFLSFVECKSGLLTFFSFLRDLFVFLKRTPVHKMIGSLTPEANTFLFNRTGVEGQN